MPARPPGLIDAAGTNDGIVRTVLPRPVNGPRTSDDHHVTRRWAGRATHSGHEIEPIAAPEQLWPLGSKHFHDPIGRISPRIVDLFERTGGRQAIVAQCNSPYAVDEQITFAVFADSMTRIDAT